jgi:2-amino-4-hydroxy-6-hydroxymethyldihydropteridine diphosphokinase
MNSRPRWLPAYVALGSNLDDPERQVRRALDALASLPRTRLVAASGLYVTRPVGPQDQPDFVNAAAALLTQLDLEALHAALRALEARLGKVAPAVRYGPRRIDLDLLAYADAAHRTDSLTVPHPRLHERAFVLYPLAELAPDLTVPGVGRVGALRARVAGGADEPRPLRARSA